MTDNDMSREEEIEWEDFIASVDDKGTPEYPASEFRDDTVYPEADLPLGSDIPDHVLYCPNCGNCGRPGGRCAYTELCPCGELYYVEHTCNLPSGLAGFNTQELDYVRLSIAPTEEEWVDFLTMLQDADTAAFYL